MCCRLNSRDRLTYDHNSATVGSDHRVRYGSRVHYRTRSLAHRSWRISCHCFYTDWNNTVNTETVESLLPILRDGLRWEILHEPDKLYLKIVEERPFLWFWKKTDTVRDSLILDIDSIDEGFAKMMIEMNVISLLDGLE